MYKILNTNGQDIGRHFNTKAEAQAFLDEISEIVGKYNVTIGFFIYETKPDL